MLYYRQLDQLLLKGIIFYLLIAVQCLTEFEFRSKAAKHDYCSKPEVSLQEQREFENCPDIQTYQVSSVRRNQNW